MPTLLVNCLSQEALTVTFSSLATLHSPGHQNSSIPLPPPWQSQSTCPYSLGDNKLLVSQLLGVAYCWGVPSGIALGFGEVGEGMEGGRLSTRGFLAEWSVGEMG